MTQVKRSRLNPLGALVLTRERIQEVLDDAVARGRMTRDDARDLFAELIRRGTAPADRVIRAAGLSAAFPIEDYDELTAAQVSERLDRLSPAQLRTVRDHERRNANRKSVLAAIDRKLP
jgi:polyhydroxyalkanoate synthesis regulator phasin